MSDPNRYTGPEYAWSGDVLVHAPSGKPVAHADEFPGLRRMRALNRRRREAEDQAYLEGRR